MRSCGAEVLHLGVDVADAAGLRDALAAHSLLDPQGVIHAAAVVEDRILRRLDEESLRRVLAPKATGAWNLHRLTQDRAPDFFVMFSSAAALLGDPGQGAYAAANAYLDGLAQFRRARGLPATSIRWGPWSESGALAEGSQRSPVRVDLSGFHPLADAIGLAMLEASVAGGDTLPVAVQADWNRLSDRLGSPALLSEVRALGDGVGGGGDPLAAVPEEDRKPLLERWVTEAVTEVLGFDKVTPVAPRAGFFDLGMDSMMSVQLRDRLQGKLRRPLPVTLAFDHPSVEAVVAYLLADRTGSPDREPEGGPSEGDSLAGLEAEIAALSDHLDGFDPGKEGGGSSS
jgi:acyl carrier protein